MKFRSTRRPVVDVNLTPLIDVVFLLLIFFMVSTTFVKESQIDLTLPQASAEVRDDPIERVEIAVSQDGTIYINQQALVNTQVTTIRAALTELKNEAEQPVVIISADANASHQSVVDVMDAARQAGMYRITFPTRQRDEKR